MNDWITHVVELQPLARKLEEHLNRKEWREAAKSAATLENHTFNVRMYCATHLDEE